jgi:hypothetical protein
MVWYLFQVHENRRLSDPLFPVPRLAIKKPFSFSRVQRSKSKSFLCHNPVFAKNARPFFGLHCNISHHPASRHSPILSKCSVHLFSAKKQKAQQAVVFPIVSRDDIYNARHEYCFMVTDSTKLRDNF